MIRYFLAALCALCLHSAKAQIILERDGIKVTVQDVDNYIETRLPPENKLNIIARPGFLKETIENIYSIRSLARGAKNNVRLNHDLLGWIAQIEADRANMKAQMVDMALQDLEQTVNWDSRAKEAYLAERKRFATPETISAAHILIKPVGRSEEEALVLAKKLRSQAISGANFTDLAIEYSEDKSVGRNQGNLGEFSRGRMVEEFEKAAFALAKPGDISDIVKSQFGYHIIKLLDKKPASKQSFEEVKDELISELKAVQEKAFVERLVTGMRTDAALAIDNEQMDLIVAKYASLLKEAGILGEAQKGIE